jgi:voltage-gated potassium channel
MDTPTPSSPEPATRLVGRPTRRVLSAMLVRTFLIVTGLLLVYYRLPLDSGLDVSAAGVIVIGLALVSVIAVTQVRSIMRSDHPGLRAAEALALILPAFIILFAIVYFTLAHQDPAAFTEPITRTDSLCFTITVLATVGFGDIAAKSEYARVVVSVQMIADLILIGFIVRAIIGTAQEGIRQRMGTSPLGGGGTPPPS